MNTRTETINGYTYCSYCGRELKNPHYCMRPEPPTICNCEKAKEELDLYDKLKKLYNAPLAESLIDKKVQKYRNELLGIKEPVSYTGGLTSVIVDTLDTTLNSTAQTIHADKINGTISI